MLQRCNTAAAVLRYNRTRFYIFLIPVLMGANLKKTILISAVLLAASSSAQSADIAARPVYTKAPAVAVANWTGFYAGVNIGYGFSDPTVTSTPNDAHAAARMPASQQFAYDVAGVLGGGQIGYNYQAAPNWLIGVEADFQGSGIKNSSVANFAWIDPAAISSEQKVEWFGTLRARAGWLANDKLLIYGTGGLAYGSVKENLSVSMTTAAASAGAGGGSSHDCITFPVGCFTGGSSKVLVGYTAGGGLEYAAWSNVTFKVEYLYVNLGSSDTKVVAHPLGANPPTSFNAHFSDLHFNVVRFGANYRF